MDGILRCQFLRKMYNNKFLYESSLNENVRKEIVGMYEALRWTKANV